MTELTPKQVAALRVLRDLTDQNPEGITPSTFGDYAYPDTAGHVNAGRGLAPHAARSQAAGSVLARLRKNRWAAKTNRGHYSLHFITPAGREALRRAGE